MILDKNDPLDHLILKAADGDPILFDEREDALGEMMEQDLSLEELLDRVGMTAAEAKRAWKHTQARVQVLLEHYGLQGKNHMRMCYQLERKAENTPEFIELLSLLLSDTGLYFNPEREDTDDEQNLGEFCVVRQTAEKTQQWLLNRCESHEQWTNCLQSAPKSSLPKMADCNETEFHEIFQMYCDLFEISVCPAALLENLELLLQTVQSSDVLRRIKPLYLYQMLTKHGSRLRKNTDIKVDAAALWKYTEYKVDEDNGKNFKANSRNLTLFERLCEICQKHSMIDLELCGYGFTALSNLGDFYRVLVPFEAHPVLLLSVEEWIENFYFRCFPEGDYEIFCIREGDITTEELNQFQESTDKRLVGALQHLSKYMNHQGYELEKVFRDADTVGVKTLCVKILEEAKLPVHYQPNNDVHENALYLGAINVGLHQLADGLAEMRLVQAVKKLTGEAVSLLVQ